MFLRSLMIFSFIWLLAGSHLQGQAFNDFEIAPHNYYENERADPMSRLLDRAEQGDYDFGTESQLPLVKKLLADLDIPESSQILLFSRTSLQRDLISPKNPRAMYFNDVSHLAWMPGGKVEIISFDAENGGRFFFEKPPKSEGEKVTFHSPRSCFGCHGGTATNYLPGPLARSGYTSDSGRRVGSVPGHNRLSHAVPFSDRWGGYFVTGAPATLEHLGNAFAVREGRKLTVDKQSRRSLETLDQFFDPALFPQTGSSMISLLVFDHQIEAHNLLMEARYRHRQYEYEFEKWDGKPTAKTAKDTEKFFDHLVRYLLFADEVSLAGHEVQRNPAFESDFLARKKTDGENRSLRDFDLQSRIFRYRLSYMIQTPLFLEAPPAMKKRVYDRLHAILFPDAAPEGYEYFDEGERQTIVSILRATHSDLPKEWKKPTAASR